MGDEYVENTVSETAVDSPSALEGEADSPVDSGTDSFQTLEVVPDTVIDYGPRLDTIQESLTAIQTHMSRPLMTTPFEEYTVGEGLVLLLLVFLILQFLVKLVKEGFSWLLW